MQTECCSCSVHPACSRRCACQAWLGHCAALAVKPANGAPLVAPTWPMSRQATSDSHILSICTEVSNAWLQGFPDYHVLVGVSRSSGRPASSSCTRGSHWQGCADCWSCPPALCVSLVGQLPQICWQGRAALPAAGPASLMLPVSLLCFLASLDCPPAACAAAWCTWVFWACSAFCYAGAALSCLA